MLFTTEEAISNSDSCCDMDFCFIIAQFMYGCVCELQLCNFCQSHISFFLDLPKFSFAFKMGLAVTAKATLHL